jgi:4-hydroxy-2-oxoheptanedioate aldolase
MSYVKENDLHQRQFSMRPSRVLRVIRNGGVASSLKVISSDPRIVETMAASGVDAIWVCTEHTPANYENIENQVRAAKVFDVDLIVRCPRGSYTDHIRGLEADAAAVMVPHVMGLADARDVVRMTKFPPLGRRACDGGNVDGLYTRVEFTEYLAQANAERFIIFQIEDPEALDELEAIAECPGVDMLFFGPCDYSAAIGMPGQIWDPQIMEIGERIAALARKAGKMAGTIAVPEKCRTLSSMGYNFLNIGGDVRALAAYSDQRIDHFRQCIAGMKEL